MLSQFFSEVKATAREAARAAAFSALGALFAVVGLAFLTVALWLLLARLETALFAATVIGALYCAVGFAFLALGKRRNFRRSRRLKPKADHASDDAGTQPREPFVQMAEGFAMGMQAGRSARSGRD